MYDCVLLCGSKNEIAGRNIAGYRLRTAAKKAGYSCLVLDCATAMTSKDLEAVLDCTISDKTLMLGISTVWLDSNGPFGVAGNSEWINDNFFNRIKIKFPKLKIVAGGNGLLKLKGSVEIYNAAHWHVTGFSDDSFPKLLMMLDGKTNHNLKYFIDFKGKKTIDSNATYKIENPNNIETILVKDDGFLAHQPIPLEVSRGCIFRCAFCNHPFTGAKDADSYIRTPESIATELRRNYELFGTTRYSLMDDTFNDSIEKLDRLEKAIELANLPNFEFQCYLKPELLVTKPEMIEQLKRLGLAGAFAGIESLNNRARKEMNKGMDIDRVLDAMSTLKSKNPKAKIYAGMIIGLPGDTVDDVENWQELFIKNQTTLFQGWEYNSLGIYSPTDRDKNNMLLSPMEKDPEKYGYKIVNVAASGYNFWRNEHMDTGIAYSLAARLNTKLRSVTTAAGWNVSSAWHLNETEENIATKTLDKLELGRRLLEQATNRASLVASKITSSS